MEGNGVCRSGTVSEQKRDSLGCKSSSKSFTKSFWVDIQWMFGFAAPSGEVLTRSVICLNRTCTPEPEDRPALDSGLNWNQYSPITPGLSLHIFSTGAMAGRGGTTRINGTAANNKICQFKLVLLGESAVGKSSLVLRFVKGQFHEYQESTIGGTALRLIWRKRQTVLVLPPSMLNWKKICPCQYKTAAKLLGCFLSFHGEQQNQFSDYLPLPWRFPSTR